MSFSFDDFRAVTAVLPPGACDECGGEGQFVRPVVHPATGGHVDDEAVTCPRCRGTGDLHCAHGVPRRDCRCGECVCAEVLEA